MIIIYITFKNYKYLVEIRPSPFFSLFSVVRPAQIFAFSKKKKGPQKAMKAMKPIAHYFKQLSL